ncbi:MAG: rod shape-determining protein RodA [Paludibacteraceae bacterium]|nr:rod shape-determining protein RodA [Paludibacteraceae bacterium]
MSRNGSVLRHIDWLTVCMFLAIALFGWINIYGASYTYEQTGIFDFSNRAGKQFIWLLGGLTLGGVIMLLDHKMYDMLAYLFYAIMILLLLITPLLAHNVKGSYSWINLGPIAFQPAEFAKCLTALAVAKYMSHYGYRLRTWRDLLIPLALIGIPMFIIMVLQQETGSALVFLSFLLPFYRQGMSGLVLLAGVLAVAVFIVVIKFSILPVAIFLVVLFAILIWRTWRINRIYRWALVVMFMVYMAFSAMCNFAFTKVLQPHQRTRIEVLLGMKNDPTGAGYNVNQARIAIGSGRFFGKGYLQGTQTKLRFVPEQDTDFIFCTVGEEWGFFGSTLLLLLYTAFILRLIYIAERQRDTFSQIYCYSVASIFLFHLTINIGMVLGLLPVIGIPLPFFSYGGSSMWGFCLLLFIALRLDAARVEKWH